MSLWVILLTAVSLAMDAFAVATCRGVEMKKFNIKHALIIGVFFGVFQAAMPIIGFYAASLFADYITAFAHWVAFALLLFIGGKMIIDCFKKEKEEDKGPEKLNLKGLIIMSIATSIDALAVGITFALEDAPIWIAAGSIGGITFALSFLGVFIGNKIGNKLNNKAQFLGGVVLILIGIKIVLEAYGVISF